MCQRVTACTVARLVIQPVRPFGRPGSLTCSQESPPRRTVRPMTGSTVRSPVIGRRARTSPTRAECLFGFENPSCARSRATNLWVGFTTTTGFTNLAGTAAAGACAAASSTSTAMGVRNREAWTFLVPDLPSCARIDRIEPSAD